MNTFLDFEVLKNSLDRTKEEFSKHISRYKSILKDYINDIFDEANLIYNKVINMQKDEGSSRNQKSKLKKSLESDIKILESLEREELFKFLPKKSKNEIYNIHNILKNLSEKIKEKSQSGEKISSKDIEEDKKSYYDNNLSTHHSIQKIYEISERLEKVIATKNDFFSKEAENLYNVLSNEIKNSLIKNIIKGHRNEVNKLKLDPITHFKTRAYLKLLLGGKDKKFNIKGAALIDLDNLKQINDKYGHLTGDKVIRRISKIILKTVLQNTKAEIIRYGGDEFLILFLDGKSFMPTLQKIIDEIRKTEIILKNEKIKVTASIGATEKVGNLYKLIRIVDKNLYKAKKQGKNQMVIM